MTQTGFKHGERNGESSRQNSLEHVDQTPTHSARKHTENGKLAKGLSQDNLMPLDQTLAESVTKHTRKQSDSHAEEMKLWSNGNNLPGPPILPCVRKHKSTSITLDWEPPYMTEYEPHIKGYIVELKQNDGWVMVYNGNLTSTVVDVVTSKSRLYEFRISAYNEIGRGKAVEYEFEPVPASNCVPNRPYSLLAESTNSAVKLCWTSPINGAKPTNYLIEKQNLNSPVWEKVDRLKYDKFTYVVRDLCKNTYYTFRVTALNDTGTSVPTDCYTYSKIVKIESNIPQNQEIAQKYKPKEKGVTVKRCDGNCSSKKQEIVMKLDCAHLFCINCSHDISDKSWTVPCGNEIVKYFVCTQCNGCTKEDDLKFLTEDKSFLSSMPLFLGYQGSSGRYSYDVCNYENTDINGIPNVGMTCYANSIFQILAQTPNLMNHLWDMISTNNLDRDHSLTGSLRNVLMYINKYTTTDNNQIFTDLQFLVNKICISDRSFQMGEQNDSHSFLIALFNGIQMEVNKEQTKDVLSMFRGLMASEFSYEPCGHNEYSDEQMFTNLLIPVETNGGMATVSAGFEKLTQREQFPDNILPCRTCESPPNTVTTKTMKITAPPEILILQLGKFRQEEYRVAKYDVVVLYDELLSLEPYIPKDTNAGYVYKLYGVTLHSGTIDEGGHYASYVKFQDNGGGGQWYICSDSFVSKIETRDILQDSGASLLFYHLEFNA